MPIIEDEGLRGIEVGDGGYVQVEGRDEQHGTQAVVAAVRHPPQPHSVGRIQSEAGQCVRSGAGVGDGAQNRVERRGYSYIYRVLFLCEHIFVVIDLEREFILAVLGQGDVGVGPVAGKIDRVLAQGVSSRTAVYLGAVHRSALHGRGRFVGLRAHESRDQQHGETDDQLRCQHPARAAARGPGRWRMGCGDSCRQRLYREWMRGC